MDLPVKYPKEHYGHKAKRYAIVLRYFFNTEVDETTQERWSDLIAFGRSIDTYLDEENKDTLEERTAAIEELLQHPDEVEVMFPSLGVEQLGVETYEHLHRFGSAILHINLHIKTTETLPEYAAYRRMEGRLYAELISSVATPEVMAQPGYKRFGRWLLKIGEVTNLINSFHDIQADHACGEVALTPNHLTRLRLLGHIVLSIMNTRPVSHLFLP